MATPSPSALRALRTLSASPYIPSFATTLPRIPTHTQIRHATLLKRPKRPYTFTQLITLSDGSSFVQRTTNPQPVYKATKDTRNTPLWNPSSQKLLNIEEDEAGKLAAFRAKFGRGWDAETGKGSNKGDHFMDLISGGGGAKAKSGTQAVGSAPAAKTAPAKGGKK
ncbi:hypothetical protein BU23DRAFT_538066 [Bimuria novae-zelandiae CBS 107.79]|uniref:Ribosomal protein bL31m N-terminal domain-containing protein n=1 Tax=Bimuria novae-zelandiae CBS 107.79 TaxID=1447943 RepID=A0A6A5VAQ7_9PLEO|nr:hypothetical protein BU23DRAFT_538066 [Bimuria novae-zelandiae CBS 107.79]